MLPEVVSTPREDEGRKNSSSRRLRSRRDRASKSSNDIIVDAEAKRAQELHRLREERSARISSRSSRTSSTSSSRSIARNGSSSNRLSSRSNAVPAPPLRQRKPPVTTDAPVYVQAICDYEAVESLELEIRTGDVIKVISYGTRNRIKGELNGLVGIFPDTVVQEYSHPVPPLASPRRSFNRREFKNLDKDEDNTLIDSSRKPPSPRRLKKENPYENDDHDYYKVVTKSSEKPKQKLMLFTSSKKYQVVNQTSNHHIALSVVARNACILLQKRIRGLLARKRYKVDLERIVFVQRIVRGYLARRAAYRIRREVAKASGVLVACPGTVQGKNGWYEFDRGDRFYFMVDYDDNWELVYGPMKEGLWKKYMKRARSIGRNLLPLPGTTAGQTGVYVNSKCVVFRMMAHD